MADERPTPAVIMEESHDSQDSQESLETNLQPAVDRLSFGDGERPIAFSQLLDSPSNESSPAGTGVLDAVDDEQILTSSRDASLGDPIFWKSEDPEENAETETSEAREEVVSEVPTRGWNLADEASTSLNESDSAKPSESLELVRDDADEESGKTSTIVEAGPLLAQDAASQASLTVESGKANDLAANPIEWMASVPPPMEEEAPAALQEWDATVAEAADLIGAKEKEADIFQSESKPVIKEKPATLAAAPVSTTSTPISAAPSNNAAPPAPSKTATAAVIAEVLKMEPAANLASPDVEDTVHSIPQHDWTDLASNIQPKAIEPAVEKSKPAPPPVGHAASAPTVNAQPAPSNPLPSALKPLAKPLENTARPAPRLEWAELAAGLQPKAVGPVAEKSKPSESLVQALTEAATLDVRAQLLSGHALTSAAAPSGSAPNGQAPPSSAELANASSASATIAAPPDPALVEAVVQRVLEKMRPQVVDIITKEFLRPVVQALVHREITKR